MATKQKDFLGLKDTLYTGGERLWNASIGANAVALVAALATVALPADGAWSVPIALIAFLAPGVSVVLREWAAVPLDRADKIRQLVLLSDSLGRPIPASEQANVRRWVPGQSLNPAPYIQPYYSSTLPAGPGRLADNLAESAYFTEHIAEKVARTLAWGGLVVIGLLVAILYVVGTATAASHALVLARGAAVAVAFLVSGDYAMLLWRFVRLKSAAQQAYRSASALRESPSVQLEDVIPVAQDYDSARVQAPPLPRWLHVLNMEELNADYRQSHGRTEGETHG